MINFSFRRKSKDFLSLCHIKNIHGWVGSLQMVSESVPDLDVGVCSFGPVEGICPFGLKSHETQ